MRERSLPENADLILGAVAKRLQSKPAPSTTYRIQLTKDFDLDAAAGVVPYLHRLGVTHLYASPFLRATQGSPHGYDVVSFDEVSPELGGEEALQRLAATLHTHGMGLICDFVPNHMGIGSENAYWQDVLENGPSAAHARFFDIVWKPVKDELEDKVLLPVLGDQYGAVLEAGDLCLGYGDGSFSIRYFDHLFPINPRHYPTILVHDLEGLTGGAAEEEIEQDLEVEELLSICTACHNLPPRTETDPERIAERRREKEVIKRRLEALLASSPRLSAHVQRTVEAFNGMPGDPASFDRLDELLAAQAYRLAHWRVAGEEINYRRFFDINDLAAIRMEDPKVFEASHRLVFHLLAAGTIDGLRIDHPDGLYDPEAYFHRLQLEHFLDLCKEEAGRQDLEVPFDSLRPLLRAAWASDDRFRKPVYIVAEKILTGSETLPDRWAVDGTTGYDFLCRLTGVLVDASAKRAFDDLYARFTGLRQSVGELLYEKKKLILHTSMASEVNLLAYALNRITETNRRSRDFTLNSLRSVLTEYIANFPVYRTYITPSRVDDQDRRVVETAIAAAKRRSPVTNVSIFDFLRDILLQRHVGKDDDEERRAKLEFSMKLQQLTGPVMAKGFEDTTFYVYNRLVALNEVGCDPAVFGCSVAEFHAKNAARKRGSLLTTTTHDTKRSEDARARLLVLSEQPEAWRKFLSTASRAARKHRILLPDDRVVPDRNEEYLLYQTLLAVWPFGELGPKVRQELVERIESYTLKAAKEAKVNTSWINPDATWDEGLSRFVRNLLADEAFLQVFAPFLRSIQDPGLVNSLSQTLLKITSPGIPDTYQGCETGCFSLVDPDNRRPVDFEALSRSLEELAQRAEEDPEGLCRSLWEGREDGRLKQYVTWRALSFRRDNDALFRTGEYLPVEAIGPRQEHVIALARRRGPRAVIAVAPRLVSRLLQEEDPWNETHILLPAGSGGAHWTDLFTRRVFRPEYVQRRPTLSLARLHDPLPLSLLVSGDRPT